MAPSAKENMKRIFIKSPDRNGNIDPNITNGLLKFIPNQVKHSNQADIVVIPVSWQHNYQFDPSLYNLNKKYVIIDFMEYGSSWNHSAKQKTHVFGSNTNQFNNLKNSAEWLAFCKFAKDIPPALYFKRELLQDDRNEKLLPCEFTCNIGSRPMQSQEGFNARKIDVFHCWGMSNCKRPELHGEIFKQMCHKRYGVISDWSHTDHHLNNHNGRTWATIFVPHFVRMPIDRVVDINVKSKMMVSMWGNGVKCFRSSECVGTIMALPYDNLAWSYEWIHGENCIRLEDAKEFDSLYDATQRDDLYKIYVNCQATLEKYRGGNYVANYIMPHIEKL